LEAGEVVFTRESTAVPLQELFSRYRGGDPDATRSVRSAANFVGLQVPADVPLGLLPADMATKYAKKLQLAVGSTGASRAEGGGRGSGVTDESVKHLQGAANLKAQLYGNKRRQLQQVAVR
jgi:hypothetical protein